MKPLLIGLLVLIGAVGGALIMMFSQRPQPVAVPVAAASDAPVPVPVSAVAEPEPAPAVVTPEPPKPSPVTPPARSVKRPKPAPVFRPPVRPARPAVTTIAQSRPVLAQPQPQPQLQPQPQPQPAAAPPAPVPVQEPPAPVAVAEPAPEPAPVEAPPTVTLKAGMLLPVRLGEVLSSEHNESGDTFTATLDAPLVADGFVIAERGARLEGRVIEAGKVSPVIRLELTKLHTSDGQHVAILTDIFRKQASWSSTGQDIGVVAAAAGIGAAIGGIAGGGKGAGIGAAIGGVAGAGGVAATKHKAVMLASETKISFRLREPVSITERTDR